MQRNGQQRSRQAMQVRGASRKISVGAIKICIHAQPLCGGVSPRCQRESGQRRPGNVLQAVSEEEGR